MSKHTTVKAEHHLSHESKVASSHDELKNALDDQAAGEMLEHTETRRHLDDRTPPARPPISLKALECMGCATLKLAYSGKARVDELVCDRHANHGVDAPAWV